MKQVFLIHFSELSLKGKNRAFFERILVQNIKAKIQGELTREFGRFILKTNDSAAKEKLAKIPGVSDFAIAEIVPKDWQVIKERTKELASCLSSPFRVLAKRSDKSFPYDSLDIQKKLALLIKDSFPHLRPSLKSYSSVLYVIIGEKHAFLFSKKIKGIGGLPTGSSGKGFVFLSGGIDSPVAGFLAMKRGLKAEFLHFFNETVQKEGVRTKIELLGERLSEYQPRTTVWLIPFGKIQKEVIALCPDKLRMIVYRRAMFRIANLLAPKRKIRAYVTGDSLGQVASQTLPNIKAIWSSAKLPVLAPLIGFNKEDIIKLAKRIDTYESSILPYQDCCRFMIARHPETNVSLEQIKKIEEVLEAKGWEKSLQEAANGKERLQFK